MEIATQSEIILRDAQYNTWTWTGVRPAVTCFENAALIGFVHEFDSVTALLDGWQERQKITLSRHATALRTAGLKAWNVYSVFLTAERTSERVPALELIEEDFSLTRKIARSAIQTPEELKRAFLPLTSVRAQPALSAINFEERLRDHLKDLSSEVVSAFLSEAPVRDITRLLGEKE